MNEIKYVFEPQRLWLTWQNRNALDKEARVRYVVAEILRTKHDDAVLHYLKGTLAYTQAIGEGFQGYPAFNIRSEVHESGILDAFMRRLPPRSRKDFPLYLNQYGLPSSFSGSDFALLSYTGAKLPSDPFEICPDLSDAKAPLDLFIEISGLRHYFDSSDPFETNEEVDFEFEPKNIYDPCAICIVRKGRVIGYVNRALCPSFSRLVSERRVSATIARTGGTNEYPYAYCLVRYR